MKFIAFERSKQGTGASRRLRNSGRTPGIVYGAGVAAQNIELDHNALWHALKKEAFHATILEMEFNGQSSQVLLRDYQMHPYKQLVQHIDFQRVDANTTLHMKVPLHYSGEEESEAVKTDKCLINHVVTEIEVACLPANLPEFIKVSLTGLTKGVSLHLNDITLPAGCKPVTHGKKNPVLVAVVAPVEEVVAAPVVAAPADAKGKGKGKK